MIMESVEPPPKRHAGDGDGYILECIHNERRKVDLFSLREEVSESDVLTIVQGSFPDCVVMHISDKYFLSFGGTHPTFNLPSTFRVFDEEMNVYFVCMINSSKKAYKLSLEEFHLTLQFWIYSKTKADKFIVKHNNEVVSHLDELILSHYKKWTSSEPLIVITETTVTYQILHPTIHEYPTLYKKFPVHDTVMDVLRKVKCRHTLVSDYTCDISLEKKVTEITEPIVFRFQLKSPSERKDQLQRSVTPASTYSKIGTEPLKKMLENERKLLANGIKMCYHRGVNAMASNDVSIYYPGFQTFADNCKSIPISAEDCQFARILCLEMAEVYLTEQKRVDQVSEVFKAYIHPSCVVNDQPNAPLADLRIANALLAEIKNEDGATDNEPLREVISYYCQTSSSNNNNACPSFLVVLTGANMTIYGAVSVGHVYVDRLIPPVWLVPQIKNSDAMINTARVLKALKDAVSERITYNVSLSQPDYPCLQGYDNDNNDWVSIKYSKEVQPHVFSGSLSDGVETKNVIIKFAETYSVHVHNLLADSNYAPTLLYSTTIGRFTAVIMEEVEGVDVKKYLTENPSSFKSIKTQCLAVTDILKSNNCVHGDLRHPNILIEGNTSVKIIDFDWAGFQGVAQYPYYLNQDECAWPDGASDGEFIRFAHDLYWINKLEELKS